jgi:chromosome segregation ATPase
MKKVISIFALTAAVWSCGFGPPQLFAQGCQDEEAMVVDYKNGIVDLLATTRKESLADFEKGYHQKSMLTKLRLSADMVDGLVECLQKASGDTAATKEQVDAYKAKLESYTKLKEQLEANQKSLKAAVDDPKAAKALIEKFDYSK